MLGLVASSSVHTIGVYDWGENRQVVTNELVELVQDGRKITDHLEEFIGYTPI